AGEARPREEGYGYGSLQDRARAAGGRPHEQQRSRLPAPVPPMPGLPPLDPRPPRRPPQAHEPLATRARKSLAREVREFHGHLWGSGSGMLMVWVINLMTSPDFLWAVFPTLGMGMGLLGHARRVHDRGATWQQIIGREKTPELSPDEVRALGPAGLASQFAGSDVLAGPHGEAVRRAAADRLAIDEVLSRLSKAELGMIPDVAPTAQALVERVASVATTLHRLDADVSGASLEALEARTQHVRAEPASADQARRLMLLERQQATLRELADRRTTLHSQLESAQLALANLKFDLYKLRSAGIAAGLADVNSATQQARAVSRDIGHAVEAAREIERL
ncbi:MAG TPA: 2TM domain-containing protein, partial [Gemmatimonadaceae bacterium]|nr:2TM domain-containing protein [Gemmatimonadaceae bacterium]